MSKGGYSKSDYFIGLFALIIKAVFELPRIIYAIGIVVYIVFSNIKPIKSGELDKEWVIKEVNRLKPSIHFSIIGWLLVFSIIYILKHK